MKDAIRYYSEQQRELEEILGCLSEYEFVKTLLETVNSMERLSTTILKHGRQHDDLEADSVTLIFLANNLSRITEVKILSPVIVLWRKIIDESAAAIATQGASIKLIQRLTNSTRLLRAMVISHVLLCL